MPQIAVLNRTTVMKDSEVKAIVAALQTQVSRDFVKYWGLDAELQFFGSAKAAPKSSWWLSVLDDSDQADALGYHDVTSSGLPLGKAFAKSDIDSGLKPSVTISHELLEMLADPEINLAAQVGDRIYAYEVCDPCEADAVGYKIGEVLVSDFVTPAWFQPVPRPGGPFDFQEKIKKPLALLPGGYLQYLELTNSAGWQQVTAAKKPMARLRPRPGSRRERRRVARESWQRSTAKG
jgi:hypothetical protein